MTWNMTSGCFIDGVKGRLFVLMRLPATPARGCILVVPPFAEEMNKSRRMVTEVALMLAGHGVASLTPDLYGTGDSGGEFAEGHWLTWQADLTQACQWSLKHGRPVTGILATRLGCALAATLISSGAIAPVMKTVLWQPVFDGSRFLGQFLRLRIAAGLVDQDRKETQAQLRTRLNAGEILEVAGYGLTGRLAAELDSIVPISELPPQFGELHWMEVVREQGVDLPPGSGKIVQSSRHRGVPVIVHLFPGEPFWASSDIVRINDMISATVAAFAPTQR